MRKLPFFAVPCAVALTCAAATVSDPLFVTTSPDRSVLWSTIPGETAKVQIVWPDEAVRGVISASNGLEMELDDTSVKSVDVDFGVPDDASAERVLDVTLEFFDASGEKLAGSTCTAQLGWVRGCDEGAFDVRASDTGVLPWRRASKRCVIPLLAGFSDIELNGEVLETPQQRHWLGMRMCQRDNVLALADAEGGRTEAALTYLAPGTVVTVR